MLMFSTFLYIKWLILQPGQRSANVSMQTKLLGESWWFDVENFNTQLLISANRLLSPRANWNTGTAPARTQLRPQPTRPTMYAMNAGSAAWTVPMMDQMYGSEDCAPEGCQIFAFSTFFGDVCACLLWWTLIFDDILYVDWNHAGLFKFSNKVLQVACMQSWSCWWIAHNRKSDD